MSSWLALAVLVAAEAAPADSTLPEEVRETARDSRNLPLAERMDRISETMLGHPYISDPLGEGQGVDPDPTVRYDAFDCLTYVEEVVALSLAGDPDHAAEVRLSLRYADSEVDYAHRNHFMELQWIPRAIEQGWMRETTSEYGTPKRMERVVDAATWKAWSARPKFALTDAQLPMGEMKLDVLDLDQAIAAADRIRPGTLLLTVREDRSWKPIWISHLGIVVPGDTPTVRHATKMGEGGTRDHGLVWYLEHLKTYDKWPAVGVAMLEPVEFGPRLSRLPKPTEAAPHADPGPE